MERKNWRFHDSLIGDLMVFSSRHLTKYEAAGLPRRDLRVAEQNFLEVYYAKEASNRVQENNREEPQCIQ